MPPRVDDSSIADDEVLWRRIIPSWLQHEPNGNLRPQSVAFIDRHTGEVSVHLASIMRDPTIALRGHPEDSLTSIRAGYPRSLGYAIVSDPKPEDSSHALICPSPTKKHARDIAKESTWVVLRDPG